MEQKKSLTMNGMTGTNFLFIINAVFMIGVGIYLTVHYYETLYPTKLGGQGTLCDFSNFFNCDAATYSRAASVFGIPTSFFGIVMGVMFLFTSLMPSENQEKTASALSKYNFIGCVCFFIFSLVSLGSLCPFCTLYYVLSGLAAFLFYKYGTNTWKPEVKNLIGWGLLVAIGAFGFNRYTADKEKIKNGLNSDIVKQYRSLADMGDPDVESPFKIYMGKENFADAPLRLTVFSDFECPFCKVVSDQLPGLYRRYPGKINIQYMFYPLSAKCNSNVKSAFHENACDGAMLAACDEKKFYEVHDDIFANQDKLKQGVLTDLAKKHGLEGCIGRQDNLDKVITSINQATKYNLKSTPTIILNGKKIEGTIPNEQFFAIFDDILAGNKK